MDNILVPVDFSQNSLNALDYAIKLAETLQSKLYVVHIAKGGVLPNFMKNANELPIEVAEDKIYKLKKKYSSDNNGERIKFIISEGTFIKQINHLIDEHDIELLIMGTQGKRKEMKTVFLGSNTMDIIEKVNYPLLIIPDHIKFKPIKKIIYATDYKFLGKHTLSPLKQIAIKFDAEVLLTSVVKDRDQKKYSKDEYKELKREHKMFSAVRHDFKRIYRSDIVKGINYYIDKKKDIDMVTLIPRKHSIYEYFFKKSTTKAMSLHPRLPVLVLHDN